MLDLEALPHRLALASVPFEIDQHLENFSVVTLKSCSLSPITGPCRFEQVEQNSFMNLWGLDNLGINHVVNNVIPKARIFQNNLIVSAFFENDSEVEGFVEIVENVSVLGIEINMTCPNRESVKSLESVVDKVRYLLGNRLNIGLKLSTDFPFEKLNKLNLDFVTYANTIKYNHPLFGPGGLSGEPLKALVQKNLPDLRKSFSGVIIACGGVKNAKDYKDYLISGADLVALGSSYLVNRDVVFDILMEI